MLCSAQLYGAVAMGGFAVAISALGCSREARHRVLVFFYDGVPPLDAEDVDVVEAVGESDTEPLASEDQTLPRVVRPGGIFRHPHYTTKLCSSCHDSGASLLKTVREGLCQTCHFQKPEEKKKYLHGPVAVNGCLVCHRHHTSQYPKILVTEAQTLCLECHPTEELTTDKYHATMDKERCIECHDPHGGDDRFFLLPGVAERFSSESAPIIERSR